MTATIELSITLVLKILLLSLLPTFEGRYALLIGIAVGLDPLTSFIIASAGVVILAVVLPSALTFIDDLARAAWNSKYTLISKFSGLYLRYVSSVRRRVHKYVDRYGTVGLILFVAIPLPATGVWTGALGAYLLGMNRWKTMISLLVGGLISNIVTLVAAVIVA
ncbi:MAG: COG2426 family protein [Desulfurococcales archaeon]|nr:COG2426 family protein [Desulfurococcales archaeon]